MLHKFIHMHTKPIFGLEYYIMNDYILETYIENKNNYEEIY